MRCLPGWGVGWWGEGTSPQQLRPPRAGLAGTGFLPPWFLSFSLHFPFKRQNVSDELPLPPGLCQPLMFLGYLLLQVVCFIFMFGWQIEGRYGELRG